ncbi:MAG: hypothetical protein IT384_13325 [Deltaproteobacteria bacterium]|nr:hypothetical protein [Deltaproteobacteria bacterium]
MSLLLAGALLWGGCADELPGFAPPLDQLHYPMGLASIGDTLLVVNSNFDQRYNAGSITALSLAEIAGAVAPAGETPRIAAALVGVRSQVKIGNFGAELVALPDASDPASGRAFVPRRGDDALTMVELTSGSLHCDGAYADGAVVEPLRPGTDCSPAHEISTGGLDPFALALIPVGPQGPAVAISHLVVGASSSPISIVRAATFTDRIARQSASSAGAPASLDDLAASTTTSASLFGATGIVFTGTTSLDSGRLLLAGGDAAVQLGPVSSIAVIAREDRYELSGAETLSLGTLANVSTLRGVVASADGRRAYFSLRFRQASTTDSQTAPAIFNSGIAVVAIEGSFLRLLRVLEVGEELGRPAILERDDGGPRRLLYLPDLRTGRLLLVDVSSDAPLVVGSIEPILGAQAAPDGQRHELMAAPFAIHFPSQSIAGRRFGLVTNFGNSTLAVIDVTATEPSQHRVVARFGRALSRDGIEEVP